MNITGSQAPCPQCRGAMEKAARYSEGRVVYQWREGGKTVTRQWDYRAN
jgi:hypothetical protein